MQKISAIVAFLVALCATQVHGFAVYLTGITIHKDYENGGIPELLVVCELGLPNAFVVGNLAGADEVDVFYVLEPGLAIDLFLGPYEEHTCAVIEADNFETYVDVDAEDHVNDILGYFTVARSDFNYNSIIKTLPGEFTVTLHCDFC